MAIADYLRKLVELKNQLVVNLRNKGVTADESEKLNTLVPKVLDIEKGTEQNVEWVDPIDGSATFAGPSHSRKLLIPEGVIKIGSMSSYLEELYIPKTVTTINTNLSAPLKKVTLPHNLTSGFSNIRNNLDVTLIKPTSITSDIDDVIGKGTYGKIPVTIIEQLSIKDIRYIGSNAFAGATSLKTLDIQSEKIGISNEAFSGCSNLEITNILGEITSIGLNAFKDTPILVNQTESIKYIFDYVISCDDKTITSVDIPENIYGIADYCFSGCNQASIIIPDNIKYIGSYSFYRVKYVNVNTNIEPDNIASDAFKDVPVVCYDKIGTNFPYGALKIHDFVDGICTKCGKRSKFKVEKISATSSYGYYFIDNGLTNDGFRQWSCYMHETDTNVTEWQITVYEDCDFIFKIRPYLNAKQPNDTFSAYWDGESILYKSGSFTDTVTFTKTLTAGETHILKVRFHNDRNGSTSLVHLQEPI